MSFSPSSSPSSSMATSMSAHRPFAPRTAGCTTSPGDLTTTPPATSQQSLLPAFETPPQPHPTPMSPPALEAAPPAKKTIKTPKKKYEPKQKLILLKDKDFKLTDTILTKIKTSSPLRPMDMPLLVLNSTHGGVKVLLHCQTTRVYLQKTGTYLGDLPWLFETAGQQLREAMEERSQQRGPVTDRNPEGSTYSGVLREDEVLVDED